jgi:hypothetical protein
MRPGVVNEVAGEAPGTGMGSTGGAGATEGGGGKATCCLPAASVARPAKAAGEEGEEGVRPVCKMWRLRANASPRSPPRELAPRLTGVRAREQQHARVGDLHLGDSREDREEDLFVASTGRLGAIKAPTRFDPGCV